MNKQVLDSLKGRVVTKEDDIYQESCESWNRAIEKQPQAIVFCESISDVATTVLACYENKQPFKIRSGRHHYEGLSTGDDALVLDVSLLNEIVVNEASQTVTLGGGVRNRETYEALGALGYPFPGGGCPTVGVAGFTLGGGWGYSARLFGLGCDNLLEMKLINYKGEHITANAHENVDLFWALRGGGGQNFGVVVEHTYKLPPKLNEGTLINFDFMHSEKEMMKQIVLAYQNLFKTVDRRLNMKLGMYNSLQKGYGIRMTGLFYGSAEEAATILQPIMKFVTEKTICKMEEMSILEANRDIQDSHPDFENYKSSGRFVYQPLTEADLDLCFELIKERAVGAYYTAISLYGLGGAVADVDKLETAFYYRDALYILGFQTVWDNNEVAKRNIEWFLPRFEHLKALTKGAFINFPILQVENYLDEYYGEHAQALIKIREKYDPFHVFDFEQAIK